MGTNHFETLTFWLRKELNAIQEGCVNLYSVSWLDVYSAKPVYAPAASLTLGKLVFFIIWFKGFVKMH